MKINSGNAFLRNMQPCGHKGGKGRPSRCSKVGSVGRNLFGNGPPPSFLEGKRQDASVTSYFQKKGENTCETPEFPELHLGEGNEPKCSFLPRLCVERC